MRLLTSGEYNDTATVPIDGSSGNVLVSTASAAVSNATTVNAIKFASSGNSLALGNQLNLTSGAILNATGGAVSITGTGPLQFGSAEGVIHTNTDMSISAPIAGTNGLTKGGAGNLTLTNTSNNFGALTLDAGKVTIDDESEIGGGGTPITINGGFLAPTSAVTSMTGHTITMASAGGFFVQNGSTLAVAGLTGTGTLENKGPGTLVLSDHDNPGFTGGIELRAGTIEINGDSNLGGTSPTSVGRIANNSLVLRFDGGALRVSSGSFNLALERNIYLNSTGTFDVAANGTLQTNSYIFGPGGLAKTGDGTMILQSRGGTQNKFIGNVQILGGTLAYADALSQNFSPTILISNYWFIDNNAALQLNFAPLSLGSRGVTLGANGGNISVPSGVTQTFPVLTGAGFLGKTGDGTLLVTAAQDYQGGTKVRAGFLSFTNDNQLGASGSDVTLDGGTLVFGTLIGLSRNIIVTANSGTILNDATSSANNTGHSITGPGTLSKFGSAMFSTNVVQTGGLNIQAGTLLVSSGRNTATKTNTVGSGLLVVASGALLNLNDNDLVYDYGTSVDASKSADVHALLASGYSLDAWNGTTGINSGSAKTNNANAANHKLGLGYAEASSAGISGTYNTKPLTGGSIIIRYTYEGDANLDGIVNALDFNALATNYGTNFGANWVQGDYNYDGSVDSNDFGLLADNFGQSAPLPGDLPDAALPADGAVPLASLGSIVPEPASLSLIGMATFGLLARRRRDI